MGFAEKQIATVGQIRRYLHMNTHILAMPSALEKKEQASFEKITAFLKKEMQDELTRLQKTELPEAALLGCIAVFKEFLSYNSSLELLVNAKDFMVNDITCLCELQGITLSERFLAALAKVHDFLSLPQFDDLIRNAVPQKIHPITKQILEMPTLTPIAYRILNNYVLRRHEHEDITILLTKESTHLNHYPFIRELRTLLPFYTILYLSRNLSEQQPAIRGIAAAMKQLFGTDIEKTIMHQKMLLATNLYRSDIEFQQGLEMFQTQINQFKHLLKEQNISEKTPLIKYIFNLLDADKKAGIGALAALLNTLVKKSTLSEETAATLRNNLEIGLNLLDKSLSHYRELLATQRNLINDELIEQIITKIISGSDFINSTRFLREIVQDYAEGKEPAYSQPILGMTLNILISKQTDFVRFDNFQENQPDIEKKTQDREIVIATNIKYIIKKILAGTLPPLPLPVLYVTLFYYRFILGLIYKEKARSHIRTSQLDLVSDGTALPNNFTVFKRIKNLKDTEVLFEPILPTFEKLAEIYKGTAKELIDGSDIETNPQLVRNLQVWLFTQQVQRATPIAPRT